MYLKRVFLILVRYNPEQRLADQCLLLDNQSENFLVQILIYKNRKVKRIIKEDEERDQEET